VALTQYWQLALGVILIVLVTFLPAGIVGTAARVWRNEPSANAKPHETLARPAPWTGSISPSTKASSSARRHQRRGQDDLVNLISASAPRQRPIFIGERDITLRPWTSASKPDRPQLSAENLFDDLSVLDNVALSIFAREGKTNRFFSLAERDGAVIQEASALLAEFGMATKAQAQARDLAQGERKLLDVAVAYALRPKLLFLDEPTSGVSTRQGRSWTRCPRWCAAADYGGDTEHDGGCSTSIAWSDARRSVPRRRPA
jgi:hypothetical protein